MLEEWGNPQDESKSEPMKVSLTLDNGPHPDRTPRALEALAARNIAATFFVLGQEVATPEGLAIARAAKTAGHRIGNHTWSHHRPLGEEPDQLRAVQEVARAQEALGDLADADRLYRPYAGKGILGPQMMSRTVFDHLKAGGYSCVIWNCVPRDWEDGWVDRALASIASRDWSVVVVHDIPRGGTEHLPEFLDRALDLGADFVTDFPSDCTPLWRGAEIGNFGANITEH